MKNLRQKTVCALACAALALTGAASFFAPRLQTFAHGQAQTKTSEPLGLISPVSYWEYLPLQAPAGVAVNDEYTAIADGTFLYLYKQNGVYHRYTHGEQISRLQFDDRDNLYFSDSSATLYRLSLPEFLRDESTQAQPQVYSCSAFVWTADMLYYTTVVEGITTIYAKPTDNLAAAASKVLPDGDTLPQQTPLSFANDRLYYLLSKTLYCIDPETGENRPVAIFPTRLQSLYINEKICACVTDDGDFTVYNFSQLEAMDLSQVTPVKRDNGGYTSLCGGNKMLYVAQNNAVKEYSVYLREFTDRQICSSADEHNRLDGATQTYLHNGTLFISDTNNGRISVYETATQTYHTPIATELNPTYLTADGETVLAANQTQAVIYDADGENYGQTLAELSEFEGNIVGAAAVYGTYYFVTDRNYFYAAMSTDGVWSLSGISHLLTQGAKSLTADAQGYLYVICGNDLVRFDESQFLTPDQAGQRIVENLPTGTKTVHIDYEQNVYAVAGNDVYVFQNAENGYIQNGTHTLDTAYVYGGESYAPSLTSLTFGIEENAAYLLYDGNYIVAVDELQLPTVKNIPTENAQAAVFSDESGTVQAVKTNENAFLVEFDLSALQDENRQTFAYVGYQRANAQLTALQLGEPSPTSPYYLIAVFDDTQKAYRTYLIQKSSCTLLQADEFQTVYAPEQQKTAYITNDLDAYKFPYLHSLLTISPLKRGQQVTLLGEMGLDYDYYHIAYQTADGAQKTGYIPKVFATLFEGTPPPTQTDIYGAATADVDELWRLAYITLGFCAICILVDYLLIRKDKNKEDDCDE